MPCTKALPHHPHPPLTATVVLAQDTYLRELFPIAGFLTGDEASGVYRLNVRRCPDDYVVEYWFSDPDTAFAMKMKFG